MSTFKEALASGRFVVTSEIGPPKGTNIDSMLHHIDLLKEKVDKGELGFKSGQGFQTWTPEQIKQSREGLVDYLIEWTKREQAKKTG